MKRFLKLFWAFALVLVLSVGFIACGKDNKTEAAKTGGEGSSAELDGTYNITVWTSEVSGVKEQFESQIAKFQTANPGIVINATVEGIGEGNAATQMISSVEDGADIFCFAQDQLARLVQAAAVQKLGVQASATVKELNEERAYQSAIVNGDLYCYPLTSDNGYYMYYDKRVVSEDHLGSLEDIIADCENAGKMFSFNLEGSGWYNASFFFATGCKTEWTTDENGKFVSVNDTFNSANGLIALKGMQKLLKSSCYNDSSNGADFDAAVPSAVVIDGTWDANTVKAILGDNYGVAELPSFTVDGKSYHLGSFYGTKLLGVKPQTDAKRAAVLQKLALFLTNEECQLERLETFGWGPTNKAAQATDAYKNNAALTALTKQNQYAVLQGQIHGSWWDISKTYATAAKAATTDEELQAALDAYKAAIDGLLSMPVDEQNAFTVIGSFSGYNWDTDVAMEQKPAGTWMTTEPISFAAGDEFKVRQGKSWDVNFGDNGDNFKVTEAGNFYVKFVYDEANNTGVITLEKVNPNYGWTLIGAYGEYNWNNDQYMEPNADGVWSTTEAVELAAGNEFKVRFGLSWDESYGDGGANFVVETAGSYYVTFDPSTTLVALVPAE